MGLSERKNKQRIIADPRNLTWANDVNRFGTKYLASLGWSAGEGQGLGRDLQGRVDPIKVKMKLGALGIGVEPKAGMADNGTSWKQNWEFEGVLKRLNNQSGEDVAQSSGEASGTSVVGFVRQTVKREENQDRTEISAATQDASVDTAASISQSGSSTPKPSTQLPRRMAHRAKFRASKQMASSSGTATPLAIQEILGISQSAAQSPAPTTGSFETKPKVAEETSNESTKKAPGHEDNLLTVSNTSLANYFAAKMKAKGLDMSGSATPLKAETEVVKKEEANEPVVKIEEVEESKPVTQLEESAEEPSEKGKQERKDKKKDKSKKRKREEQNALLQEQEQPVEALTSDDKPKKKKKKKKDVTEGPEE